MKRSPLPLTALFLLIPAALITYRVVGLGYPLFPTAPGERWQISLGASISKSDSPNVFVWVALPDNQPELTVFQEQFVSGILSVHVARQGPNRFGAWWGRVGEEGERIAYRATLAVHPGAASKRSPLALGPYPAGFEKPEEALAVRLVSKWRKLPPAARLRAVAQTLGGEWGTPPPKARDLRAWWALEGKHGSVTALLALFRAARLHARALEGLPLVESVRSNPLRVVEVWSGQRWERLRPETGEFVRIRRQILPLTVDGVSAIRVSQGKLTDTRWAVRRSALGGWHIHYEHIMRSGHLLDRWSLFHLPQEFQETFRILLLVPIGALLMSALRNVVGLPTFGVFMPVLMALAFRNTGLAYGLAIFTFVVGIGYFIRQALDRMRLLLVPRLSLMLTLVIACLTLLALLGNKFGLREFMAVGLLPFVILTMVIERFFVLIEESGVREGVKTGLGSAAAAVIGYGILQWERLQLTFFIFPELLFAIAALQVVLGRYTGYRLSELLRFREVRSSS